MNIDRVKEILNAEILLGEEHLDYEVEVAYGCDLMSDVLAYVQGKVILLTGLVHPQLVRTAEMMDIKAIVVVRGKEPSDELLKLAKERDLIIVRTTYSLFTSCGLLYKEGLVGVEIADEFTLRS